MVSTVMLLLGKVSTGKRGRRRRMRSLLEENYFISAGPSHPRRADPVSLLALLVPVVKQNNGHC